MQAHLSQAWKNQSDIQNCTVLIMQKHHKMPPQIDYSLPFDPATSSAHEALPHNCSVLNFPTISLGMICLAVPSHRRKPCNIPGSSIALNLSMSSLPWPCSHVYSSSPHQPSTKYKMIASDSLTIIPFSYDVQILSCRQQRMCPVWSTSL